MNPWLDRLRDRPLGHVINLCCLFLSGIVQLEPYVGVY